MDGLTGVRASAAGGGSDRTAGGGSDRTPGAVGPPDRPVAEPRQRWRIVFARDEPGERSHREIAEDWIAQLTRSGLPLPRAGGRPRPPLTFAAPLPTGVVAAREYADLQLADRLPVADVRQALATTVPSELRLVDLYDVWLGAPPLQAVVIGAEHRVELDGVTDLDELAVACRQLLAAATLERDRPRGGGTVRYDLRPLLEDVWLEDVSTAAGGGSALRIRTRFHAERGAGRPEEVVAALGEALGTTLVPTSIHRERLVLVVDG